jgi:hypothetical protein
VYGAVVVAEVEARRTARSSGWGGSPPDGAEQWLGWKPAGRRGASAGLWRCECSALTPGCGRTRRSAGRGLPYVEAALPQRRLGPVDLRQRSPLAARRGADLKPLAGHREDIDVGAAQCPQPKMLRRNVGPGLGRVKLRAQPAEPGAEPLDRLGLWLVLVPPRPPALGRPAGTAQPSNDRASYCRREQEDDHPFSGRAHIVYCRCRSVPIARRGQVRSRAGRIGSGGP